MSLVLEGKCVDLDTRALRLDPNFISARRGLKAPPLAQTTRKEWGTLGSSDYRLLTTR